MYENAWYDWIYGGGGGIDSSQKKATEFIWVLH